METKYVDLRRYLIHLDLLTKSQNDPYYHNWIGEFIKRIIFNLQKTIKENNQTNHLDKELEDFLAQFTDLYRQYIRNHPWNGFENFIDSIKPETVMTNSPPTWNKIGWLKEVTSLEKCYSFWTQTAKINCDYSIFEGNFIGNTTICKIPWLSGLGELVYTFSEMIDKKIIPFHRDYIVVVSRHFCKKNGEELKQTSLRTMKSRGLSNYSMCDTAKILINKINEDK